MTIYKYPVSKGGVTELEMPKGATFLDVQVQRGEIVLWFAVDPERRTTRRLVMVYNTGAHLNDEVSGYLGTVQLLEGDLVKHIFIR